MKPAFLRPSRGAARRPFSDRAKTRSGLGCLVAVLSGAATRMIRGTAPLTWTIPEDMSSPDAERGDAP